MPIHTGRSTSMSDFDAVGRVVRAFHRAPVTALEFAHPDVELHVRLHGAGGGAQPRWRGQAAVLNGIAPIFASFVELHGDVLEVADFGRGFLVARIRHLARGSRSQAFCRSELFHSIRLRDGFVVRWEVFLEEAAALASAAAAQSMQQCSASSVVDGPEMQWAS